MRQAGTISTKQDADRFADYLLTLGIATKVEPAADAWAIWVRDENQIARSREELEQFQHDPADSRYRAAEQVARAARRDAAAKERQAKKQYIDMRREFESPFYRRRVTIMMIVTSVLMMLGVFEVPQTDLLFYPPAIEQGQLWRLVTPIFMHVNLVHLLFNMWMLLDLGTLVERRLGWWRYVILVLLIAVSSNGGQYLWSGPNFMGMSGVVYGLFGYAWVRGRLDPTSGLYLRSEMALWMIGWFVFCLFGPLHVANAAHGVGLAVGALLGYLPSIRKTFA
jgi:GlpG protein